MRLLFPFLAFLFSSFSGLSQNIDSILAEPQEIALSISTPQPRLNETFQISLDINHLKGNIFRSLAGKVRLSNDINVTHEDQMTMKVTAVQKGKIEIGPLEFYVNKTRYTTNKITYEVVDPLPPTDSGLWIRKVRVNEDNFCIIIDQRIPAVNKQTNPSENTIEFTTQPVHENLFRFKDTYSIRGVNGAGSYSTVNFGSVWVNGEQRQFMYGTAIHYFTIVDKNSTVRISKDVFMNFPEGYEFEEIVIQ